MKAAVRGSGEGSSGESGRAAEGKEVRVKDVGNVRKVEQGNGCDVGEDICLFKKL